MLTRMKLLINRLISCKCIFWVFYISILLCFGFVVVAARRKSAERSAAGGTGARGAALAPEELARRVQRLNAERVVRNEDVFAAPDPRAVVLAVTARRGAARLQRLLDSLERVSDIASALLVVSHSYYDEEINQIVRGVRFCRLLQIYYPYSRQLYPDRFPGPDRSDCPADFCPPRDAALAERKHHWWWTAQFLFNQLDWDGKHSGAVLFLQEDDYVLPDALYMLQYAERALLYHPEVDMISLGRPAVGDGGYDLLTIDPWRPPLDRGLVLNASMWRRIEGLAARFCSYDDASWSYSLLHLLAGLPRGRAEAVTSVAPRVLAGCRAAAAALFPARVRCVFVAAPDGRAAERLRTPPGAGGWSDPRDHLLCLDPVLATTTGNLVSTVPYHANLTSA